MYDYPHWLDRSVDKNVIDAQHRKSRRERSNRFGRWYEVAHIAKMVTKHAIWPRTAQTIEVAE